MVSILPSSVQIAKSHSRKDPVPQHSGASDCRSARCTPSWGTRACGAWFSARGSLSRVSRQRLISIWCRRACTPNIPPTPRHALFPGSCEADVGLIGSTAFRATEVPLEARYGSIQAILDRICRKKSQAIRSYRLRALSLALPSSLRSCLGRGQRSSSASPSCPSQSFRAPL